MANLTANLVDVEVEFDYVAELGDELTIQTGDIINDVKRMSGGWWEGTLNGKRGLFPDNFVKVMSNDVSKTQQTLVGTSAPKDPVQLRTSQKKHGTVAARKRCRVLYSYQPKHEDELELKVDDIIDFESEVEDGWWKGSLRGQCGVFPSNFVELLRSSVSQLTAAASGSGEDETNLENRVADKNKKNEKLRVEKSSIVSGRISSIIQEAETKMKKKSAENLNIAKRESLVTAEYSEKAKPEVGAPKLPPKPIKEQCVVLFPYCAVNDDELSLEEGQIINIVTKEVEDKGWWKGEHEGKVGVFPDNFVKLINSPESTNSTNVPQEEPKGKKPSRPPAATGGSKRESTDESLNSSKNSSREQLSGSHSSNLDRVSSFGKSPLKKSGSKKLSADDKSVAKTSSASSSNLSSPVKHSFGKSTPPPKPKPPAIAVSKMKEEEKSDNKVAPVAQAPTLSKGQEVVKEKVENVEKTIGSDVMAAKSVGPSESEFDSVQRGIEKLQHPTAERVKAPKRRPPSSVFVKEARSSSDSFEVLQSDVVSRGSAIETSSSNIRRFSGSRSNSQASLSSLDELNDKENHLKRDLNQPGQENKNRISFKLVKQTMKEAFTGLTNSNSSMNSSKAANDSDNKLKQSAPQKPPPPHANSEGSLRIMDEKKDCDEKKEVDDKKKPDWLEELSRKQAHRKSGLFSDTKVETISPTSVSNNALAKPAVAIADKPHLPIKPSQIRDDARKSMVFQKRDSSTEKEILSSVGNGNGNGSTAFKSSFIRQSSKPELKNFHSDSKSQLAAVPTTLEKTQSLPTSETSPKTPPKHQESVEKVSSPSANEKGVSSPTADPSKLNYFAGGWKPPSPIKDTVTPKPTNEVKPLQSNLADKVRVLEQRIDDIETQFNVKIEALQRQLDDERSLRLASEKELENLKRNLQR